jgi:DNA-binding NarL/FixJ family response regulator
MGDAIRCHAQNVNPAQPHVLLVEDVCGTLARAVVALDQARANHPDDGALAGAVAAVRERLGEASALLASLGGLPARWGREPPLTAGSKRELLTPREQEILSLLAGGHAYAEIAKALAIGLGTVQSHVKSIYRKLEVGSKAEAVGVALTEGILRRDPRA